MPRPPPGAAPLMNFERVATRRGGQWATWVQRSSNWSAQEPATAIWIGVPDQATLPVNPLFAASLGGVSLALERLASRPAVGAAVAIA